MKHIRLSLGVIICCTSMQVQADDQITNLASDKLAWIKTQEGAEFAPLEGDRFSGPYRAMVRLPAGVASPLHTKSATMYGIVLSGTFVHTIEGASSDLEIPLMPGSYYKIPAGFPHISKCISLTPCVTYLYQDGAFDFLPVQK